MLKQVLPDRGGLNSHYNYVDMKIQKARLQIFFKLIDYTNCYGMVFDYEIYYISFFLNYFLNLKAWQNFVNSKYYSFGAK